MQDHGREYQVEGCLDLAAYQAMHLINNLGQNRCKMQGSNVGNVSIDETAEEGFLLFVAVYYCLDTTFNASRYSKTSANIS